MPSKQLLIDGVNAKIGIVNYDNRINAMNDPINNLNDVYFHTDLPYIRIAQTIESNINFVAVPRTYYTYPDDSIC